VVIWTLNAPGSRIRNVLPVGSSGPILPDPNPLNSGFIPGSSPFASLFTFRLPVLVLYLKLCDGLFPATFYFPADDNVLRLQSGEVRYLVIVCFFWGGGIQMFTPFQLQDSSLFRVNLTGAGQPIKVHPVLQDR
jgi:hypothetical protein